MFVKVQLIFILCGWYISEIVMQNLGCTQIDFNNIAAVDTYFMPCETDPLFEIQSYEGGPINSYRRDSTYYLTNLGPGTSCIRTIQEFNLDRYTTIDLAAYFEATSHADYIEVLAFDRLTGDISSVIEVESSEAWNLHTAYVTVPMKNALIEIRATVSDDAVLGIEFLYVTNSGKPEPNCERPDMTLPPEETTTESTTTDSTTTESTTTDSTTTESTTTESTTSESTTTESTTSESTTTESTTSESTTTESTTSESTTTESTTSESTTTESTTSESTTIDSTTSAATISPPNPPPNGSVWVILSFSFFLTTFLAATALIYTIYLYKTAVFTKKSLLMASLTKSPPATLPRLTIANSVNGDHIIVGIEKIENPNINHKPKRS